MDMMIWIWVLFGIASAIVMSNKGMSGCGGFALGILLGPIGFIIALVIKPNKTVMEADQLRSGESKRCPICAELVRPEAIICRFCGAELLKPIPFYGVEEFLFTEKELSFYQNKQLIELYNLLQSEKNPKAQADVYAAICRKIGREPREGAAEDFLLSYYNQLLSHLKAKG